ncbi:MAG: LysE family transporter [Bacteroidia bacterium]|nr:LysE family transporter [Bacteroidia bacterium]HQV00648.1 LysE family transporter [Bacteroidia bacterium]
MLSAISDGFFVGVALAFLIGPVFFMLIQTSIEHGLRQAIALAFGVLVSDALFILIAELGSNIFFNNNMVAGYVGYIGGVILIAFGAVNFYKKPSQTHVSVQSKTDVLKTIIKGFAMNSFNPFVLIFWLGVAGSLAGKSYESNMHVVFYASVLTTVFGTDILKSYLATKLQRLLTATVLVWMNRISGVALVLFGMRIIYKSWLL